MVWARPTFASCKRGGAYFAYNTSGEGERLYNVGEKEIFRSLSYADKTFAEASFFEEKAKLSETLTTYSALPLKCERYDGAKVYYCYSPKLRYAVCDNGLIINLQIIVYENSYIVATPTFIESF